MRPPVIYAWLVVGIMLVSRAVFAKPSVLPVSAYRKYFWAARDAYGQRAFREARQFLRKYRQAGSPADPLLKKSGCDLKAEVADFASALKRAERCLAHPEISRHWVDPEKAKLEITLALRQNDLNGFDPYLDCGLDDLTPPPGACQSRLYPSATEWKVLGAKLMETPEVMKNPNWRQYPADQKDARRVRWILYTNAADWSPCGMEGAPIVALRQNIKGEIQISGMAAGCLKN